MSAPECNLPPTLCNASPPFHETNKRKTDDETVHHFRHHLTRVRPRCVRSLDVCVCSFAWLLGSCRSFVYAGLEYYFRCPCRHMPRGTHHHSMLITAATKISSPAPTPIDSLNVVEPAFGCNEASPVAAACTPAVLVWVCSE